MISIWEFEYILSSGFYMFYTKYRRDYLVITSWMFHFQSSPEMNNQEKMCVCVCMCDSLEQHTLKRIVLCIFFCTFTQCVGITSLYYIYRILDVSTAQEATKKIIAMEKEIVDHQIYAPSTVCDSLFSSLFHLTVCVCIMFIRSHVSDDYLLKELTIPCNLPGKSTLVFCHSVSSSKKTKPSTNQIHLEMKRNGTAEENKRKGRRRK